DADEQAQNARNLLHDSGLTNDNVKVVQVVDPRGIYLIEAPDDLSEGDLSQELSVVPGFAGVVEHEELQLPAGTVAPDGTFIGGPGLDDAPSDDSGDSPSPSSWLATTTLAPSTIGTMMLLPNGNVLAEGSGVTNTWYQLTPA